MSVPSASTTERLDRLFAGLDYAALGAIYCDDGGEAFWDAHREPALRLGVDWAAALAKRLTPGGCSLYVGAGVAELPALLTEACDLNRSLRIQSLEARECATLNESLAEAGLEDRIVFEHGDASVGGADIGDYDHLSLVSVLTDPERYPQVSGVTYGRVPPVLLDVDAFVSERQGLRGLVGQLLGGLRRPGLVTTTIEEVPWILTSAEGLGRSVRADDEVIETAIVGDPLGFLAID